MTYYELYSRAYQILNHTTPLEADCGLLCDARCCLSEGDEECGMYLFPGEEVMFRDAGDWVRIEESDFISGGKSVPILFCEPPCPRDLRPLACRIFPLVPYLKNDEFRIIKDPRGRGMCPLFWAEESQFSDAFVKKTDYVCRFLLRIPELRQYIADLSEILDSCVL